MRTLTLITGAHQGLGRAVLNELLARSEPVIALSRMRPDSPDAVWVRIDLSLFDEAAQSDVAKALDGAICLHNPDRLVFVNNAAVITPIAAAGEIGQEALLTACRINYLSPSRIAGLIAGKAGVASIRLEILNISSGAALRPIPGWAAYCSTKAAIRSFLDVLAMDTGFVVHHIDPGVMDTGMQREIRATSPESFPDVDRFAALAADGKLMPPEKVAARIVEAHYPPGEVA